MPVIMGRVSEMEDGEITSDMAFYEGTEKLLEVWFLPKNVPQNDNKEPDLRCIPRHAWEKLLELANCEIISFTKNETLDAYVLSESSMFVSKRRFILKTCGTTTLLLTVKPLLSLVLEMTGFGKVEDFFYSHKNWMQPSLQQHPHQNFHQEAAYLDQVFEGEAYVMGTINADCWYFYRMHHDEQLLDSQPSQTLEVMMTRMDRSVMQEFYRETNGHVKQITKGLKIDQLFPEAIVDDILFDPCGYSANGIFDDECYFTIHVTPEPNCSYVSFETNAPQACYYNLLNDLISIFKPGKFLMTIVAAEDSISEGNTRKKFKFDGFRSTNTQFSQFPDSSISCTQFARAVS